MVVAGVELSNAVIGALAALCALVVSWCITFLASRKLVLLDNPTARSSHKRPTSRAGGLAIFTGWLSALTALALLPGNMQVDIYKLIALTSLATAVGFVDDLWSLAPLRKLIGQIICAALFVVFFGAIKIIPIPFVGAFELSGPLIAIGAALTIFWIVAFMNVFNFMDGANGIAGVSAVCALLLISFVSVGYTQIMVPAILMSAALSGFLWFNFPVGRIFMGDSGSHGVGFLLAALGVIIVNNPGTSINAFFLPTVFMPFIADVAFTLVHRLRRGKNIFSAHNEHIYQLVMRGGASHERVAFYYFGATALCGAIALIFDNAPLGVAWAGPVMCFGLLAVPGLRVYAQASKMGLLATDKPKKADIEEDLLGAAQDGVISQQNKQAAE